jgi:hypothetical protein
VTGGFSRRAQLYGISCFSNMKTETVRTSKCSLTSTRTLCAISYKNVLLIFTVITISHATLTVRNIFQPVSRGQPNGTKSPLCYLLSFIIYRQLQTQLVWLFARHVPTSTISSSEISLFMLKKLNSVAFSPQANYTDRATAACRGS